MNYSVDSNLNLKTIGIVKDKFVKKKGLLKGSYLNLKVTYSMFLSYFIYDLIQFRGILEKLLMFFGTFCNVFISSYVFLVFQEPRSSNMFLM